MKKIIPAIALVTVLSLTVGGIVAAQGGGGTPDYNVPEGGNITDVLKTIRNWLFTILVFIAAIAFIIAGYLFITAGGDAEKVEKARNFVIYGIVAVVVGGLAWVLVKFAGTLVNVNI